MALRFQGYAAYFALVTLLVISTTSASKYTIDEDVEDIDMHFDINTSKPQIRHYHEMQAGSVMAKTIKLRPQTNDEEIKRRLVAYDLDPILPPYDDVYDRLVLKAKLIDDEDLESESPNENDTDSVSSEIANENSGMENPELKIPQERIHSDQQTQKSDEAMEISNKEVESEEEQINVEADVKSETGVKNVLNEILEVATNVEVKIEAEGELEVESEGIDDVEEINEDEAELNDAIDSSNSTQAEDNLESETTSEVENIETYAKADVKTDLIEAGSEVQDNAVEADAEMIDAESEVEASIVGAESFSNEFGAELESHTEVDSTGSEIDAVTEVEVEIDTTETGNGDKTETDTDGGNKNEGESSETIDPANEADGQDEVESDLLESDKAASGDNFVDPKSVVVDLSEINTVDEGKINATPVEDNETNDESAESDEKENPNDSKVVPNVISNSEGVNSSEDQEDEESIAESEEVVEIMKSLERDNKDDEKNSEIISEDVDDGDVLEVRTSTDIEADRQSISELETEPIIATDKSENVQNDGAAADSIDDAIDLVDDILLEATNESEGSDEDEAISSDAQISDDESTNAAEDEARTQEASVDSDESDFKSQEEELDDISDTDRNDEMKPSTEDEEISSDAQNSDDESINAAENETGTKEDSVDSDEFDSDSQEEELVDVSDTVINDVTDEEESPIGSEETSVNTQDIDVSNTEAEDTGAEDTGAADTGAADTGAEDTGAEGQYNDKIENAADLGKSSEDGGSTNSESKQTVDANDIADADTNIYDETQSTQKDQLNEDVQVENAEEQMYFDLDEESTKQSRTLDPETFDGTDSTAIKRQIADGSDFQEEAFDEAATEHNDTQDVNEVSNDELNSDKVEEIESIGASIEHHDIIDEETVVSDTDVDVDAGADTDADVTSPVEDNDESVIAADDKVDDDMDEVKSTESVDSSEDPKLNEEQYQAEDDEILPKPSANEEFVRGLDDLHKFLEKVDVPDELDVGAGGLSIQEVLLGQGVEIIKTRVSKGVDRVKSTFQIVKTEGAQKWNRFKVFLEDQLDIDIDGMALSAVERLEGPYQNIKGFITENRDKIKIGSAKRVVGDVIASLKSILSNIGIFDDEDEDDDLMDFGDLEVEINDGDMAEMRRKLMERYN